MATSVCSEPGRVRLFGAGLLVLLGVSAAPANDWKLDVLRLKNGRQLAGLLVEEMPSGVRFQCIRQQAGRRTFVFSAAKFLRSEIDGLDRLSARDREQLITRLKALDPTGKGEQQRMNDLDLLSVPWDDQPRGGLCYRSEQFVLTSNANEDIVRRAAVRLEDIFAAFTSHLPPRHASTQAPRVLLVESLDEYHKMLKADGYTVRNLAFFDRSANQVVCASDLQSMGEDLKKMRQAFGRVQTEYDDWEVLLDNQFGKGKGPIGWRQDIADCRRRMAQKWRENEQIFDKATQRLFQTLYHEAFHVYLDNFVYAPSETDVPRWLNEGLAQIFESAIVEAGELRVGHADEGRLTRAKALARGNGGQWVPVTDLLRSGPRQFLALHEDDKLSVADRHYLMAWALAFYLTFERQLLGTERLHQYVVDCKRDPIEAFQKLVGQPLPEFEKAFRHYVVCLRPDGTVSPLPPP